jgi:hypothetical protein
MCVVSLVLVGLQVSPADAHRICAVLHTNPALPKPVDKSYACLDQSHRFIFVCDKEVNDRHRVYARVYRNGKVRRKYDRSGTACSFYPARIKRLNAFKVCVEYEGCGIKIRRREF